MASTSGFNGVALGAVLAGSVFVWAGLKGYSVLSAVQDLVRGKSPENESQANPVSSAASSAGGALGVQSSALPSSGTYNTQQLESLWVQAGGSQSTAQNAACHAMQESSGNPAATSSNPDGGTNVGLWQLDTKGVGAGYSVAELQNAMNNARITVMATRNGTNWSAWATPGC